LATAQAVGIRADGSWSEATIRDCEMGERRAQEGSGLADSAGVALPGLSEADGADNAAADNAAADDAAADDADGPSAEAAAGSEGAAGALRQEARRKAAKHSAAAALSVLARVI